MEWFASAVRLFPPPFFEGEVAGRIFLFNCGNNSLVLEDCVRAQIPPGPRFSGCDVPASVTAKGSCHGIFRRPLVRIEKAVAMVGGECFEVSLLSGVSTGGCVADEGVQRLMFWSGYF